MRRILTWYVPTPLSVGAGQQETHRLDGEYVPVRAWVHLKGAPTGQPLIVDINVDGVSIFALRPTLQPNQTEEVEERAFNSTQFSKDGLVTLDIDQLGSREPGKDMTVGLELELME